MRAEFPEPPDDSVTLAGAMEAVRLAGDTVVVRATLPAKPPRLVTLTVEEPD